MGSTDEKINDNSVKIGKVEVRVDNLEEDVTEQKEFNRTHDNQYSELCSSVNVLGQEVKEMIVIRSKFSSMLWRITGTLLVSALLYFGKGVLDNYNKKIENKKIQQIESTIEKFDDSLEKFIKKMEATSSPSTPPTNP